MNIFKTCIDSSYYNTSGAEGSTTPSDEHECANFGAYSVSFPENQVLKKGGESAENTTHSNQVEFNHRVISPFQKGKKHIESLVNLIKVNPGLLEMASVVKIESDFRINTEQLFLLLSPRNMNDEAIADLEYFSDIDESEIKGVPLPGMRSHSLKEGTEPNIKTIYSYKKDDQDWRDIWIAYGELDSGDVFQYRCDWDGSRGDMLCNKLLIAPGWSGLIDNLSDDELNSLIFTMSESNSDLLNMWLKSSSRNRNWDYEELGMNLKIILDSKLREEFCLQMKEVKNF